MAEIIYDPRVWKDLLRIDPREQDRIKTAIHKKLSVYPELYGKRLTGTLAELWRMRVGDYRVIYKADRKTVTIIAVGNRKNIYKTLG